MKHSKADKKIDDQNLSLEIAETVSSVTTVIDQTTGTHYGFRKFLCLENWGICDADVTQVIVPAKKDYSYVAILIYSQVLIAGSTHTGWDVYSLTGEYLKHLPPMTSSKATRILDEQKRNS